MCHFQPPILSWTLWKWLSQYIFLKVFNSQSKYQSYLGRETVTEIPMASKDRKIEALMVIFERSGRTICLKKIIYCCSLIDTIYLYLSYAISTTEKDEKEAKAVWVHPFSLQSTSYSNNFLKIKLWLLCLSTRILFALYQSFEGGLPVNLVQFHPSEGHVE